MVIKGTSCAGANRLAVHLMRTDTNEVAEVYELRDVAAQDLRGALREMEAVALGCPRCTKPFYHASINWRADESLTDQQRMTAIDRLAGELGLSGQPRAIVVHRKEGREHCHIVWSRIELERMRAISDSHNYRKHEIVARELEREFGHARVQGAHVERDGQPRPERTPGHDEMQQATRTGLSPKDAAALLTEIWQQTDSGRAFAAALEEQSWTLARGDRRDFVAIDPHGETHSLSRRIGGAKAKDIRQRMADLDAQSLPSVAEVRAARIKEGTQAMEPDYDRQHREEIERLQAMRVQDEHVTALRQQAERQVEDTRKAQETARASETLTEADKLKALHERELATLREMQAQEARLEAFKKQNELDAEEARKKLEATKAEQVKVTQEGEINSAEARYRIALGENYSIRDPYGSLARAAMSEYATFQRQQEEMRQALALEQDPGKKREIELKMKIEGADYMALTSERLARINVNITGREDSPGAIHDRERAATYRGQATELRDERSQLIAARMLAEEREKANPAPQHQATAEPTPAREAERPQTARSEPTPPPGRPGRGEAAPPQPAPIREAEKPARQDRSQAKRDEVATSRQEPKEAASSNDPAKAEALMVLNPATGQKTRLTDFMKTLPPERPAPAPINMATFLNDPAARKAHEQAIVAARNQERQAGQAVEKMRNDMQKGNGLSPSDIEHLTPAMRDSIRSKGDDGVRQIVDTVKNRGNERERD